METKRYCLIVSYDGTDFGGFQLQPNVDTIQGVLENVLLKLFGHPIRVHGSGRTDAGVHAEGQVVHFDAPAKFTPQALMKAFNGNLPKTIRITQAQEAHPRFHARFWVTQKTYTYRVDIGTIPSPFLRHFASHYPYPVNLDRLNAAANLLTGTHDYASFVSGLSPNEEEETDTTRTIHSITTQLEGSLLTLTFTGSGFLYKMVRNLTAAILEVGQGTISIEKLRAILEGKDRSLSPKSAPAKGLTLTQVLYRPAH